jgi:uncharacterized protein (TIGR00730 family)
VTEKKIEAVTGKAITMPDPLPLGRAPLAYENQEFIDSPEGRLIRISAEYAEPLARFRREKIQDTVVFFGSARFHARDQMTQQLEALDATATNEARSQAQFALEMSRYYEDARTLAYRLTEWALTLKVRRERFVVTSGGGPGIMEAANRGAHEAGGKTIGLNIKLPFEQAPNQYVTPALNFEFSYFFMRKFWFAYLAKGLVVFPGGFGTLDEMFELLTLAQTDKLAKKIVIILYGSEYWNAILNFDVLVEKGAISPKDRHLFRTADNVDDAFNMLQSELTGHHLDTAGRFSDDDEHYGPEIAHTR